MMNKHETGIKQFGLFRLFERRAQTVINHFRDYPDWKYKYGMKEIMS